MTDQENKDKAILFIAQQINHINSTNNGHSIACHWFCLKKDLQEQYLKEARKKVKNWWDQEIKLQISREAHFTKLIRKTK